MLQLVELDDVKQRLKIDSSDDDLVIEGYIYGASMVIKNFLKAQADEILDLDSSGELQEGFEVPGDVVTATVALVGWFYKHPDEDLEKYIERGYLPNFVTCILWARRDPALA